MGKNSWAEVNDMDISGFNGEIALRKTRIGRSSNHRGPFLLGGGKEIAQRAESEKAKAVFKKSDCDLAASRQGD